MSKTTDRYIGHITKSEADTRFVLIRQLFIACDDLATKATRKRGLKNKDPERYGRFAFASYIAKLALHTLDRNWEGFADDSKDLLNSFLLDGFQSAPRITDIATDSEWQNLVNLFNQSYKGYSDLTIDTKHEYIADPRETIMVYAIDPMFVLMYGDYTAFAVRLSRLFECRNELVIQNIK